MLPTTPTAEITRSTVSVCVAALAVVDGGRDAVGLLVELRHLGAGHDLDALPLEALAREGRDLGVLDGQDLRQHLHHRHLRAQRAEERGELDADGARADHQQRLRDRRRHHRLEVGPHQLLVGLDARQHARPRAGGDDDVLGLVAAGRQRALGRLALRRLDGDLAGRLDGRLAPDHGDLVLLHQEGDAGVEPRRPPCASAPPPPWHRSRPSRRTGRSPWRAAGSGRPRPSAAAPWSGCSPS